MCPVTTNGTTVGLLKKFKLVGQGMQTIVWHTADTDKQHRENLYVAKKNNYEENRVSDIGLGNSFSGKIIIYLTPNQSKMVEIEITGKTIVTIRLDFLPGGFPRFVVLFSYTNTM